MAIIKPYSLMIISITKEVTFSPTSVRFIVCLYVRPPTGLRERFQAIFIKPFAGL